MLSMYISSSLCIMIPLLILTLANITFMRSNGDREKSSPFECGFDPMKSARIPFSTRFFLLAVVFIVFDIEIVLLIPIPLIMTSYTNSSTMLISFMIFMLILLMGLIHEWLEGSLNWTN